MSTSESPTFTTPDKPKHRVVIRMDASDTWPYVAGIECDWGTDPGRPCRIIHCDLCEVDANDECLDGEEAHEGAHVVEGCGAIDWMEADGVESIRIKDLRVEIPADLMWNGDGWTLTCQKDARNV